MRGWMVRWACHAVVVACITFLLVFHVATRGDLPVTGTPARAVVAVALSQLWLTPFTRPLPPARVPVRAAAAAAVATPVVRLLDEARPVTSLPSLPHPYVYASWTLEVVRPPGGHYSAVLDKEVRRLARAFFVREARPLRDVVLVNVSRQRQVTPTLRATYYAAVRANSAPALKAFGEYCGWSRTGGGGAAPATPVPSLPPSSDPTVPGTPADASPVPTPSAGPSVPPPGSALAVDLRRKPDMARMSAALVAPVSLDTHAGEAGAVVNGTGVVVPVDGGGGRNGHGPGLAIGLAVGLSLTAAVVVAAVALVIHRRRSDRYAPWLAASRRSSAATDADHGRRTSTVGDGGGPGGGGGGGWHRPRWTMASFSLSPPAMPPRAAQEAPSDGGGSGGQDRLQTPTGEKRVSWK